MTYFWDLNPYTVYSRDFKTLRAKLFCFWTDTCYIRIYDVFMLFNVRYNLSTSNSAIAALLCALYPHFPAHSTDNRWEPHSHIHTQKLRAHWYFMLMLLSLLQLPPSGPAAPGCVSCWATPVGPCGCGLPEALLRPIRGYLQGKCGKMDPVDTKKSVIFLAVYSECQTFMVRST